jgi:hypothetical protein
MRFRFAATRKRNEGLGFKTMMEIREHKQRKKTNHRLRKTV